MTIYFTCKGRNDGIGAQACGIISVMVIAKAFDFTFVYTPLKSVAHYPYENPSQTELKLWKMAWEQLLNFEAHHGLLHKTRGIRKHIDKKQITSHFKLNKDINGLYSDFQKGYVYSTRETHELLTKYQQYPIIAQGWTLILKHIRDNYGRDKNKTPHFSTKKNVVNIAVHVRRGDSTNNKRRFVGHQYFVNVLDSITKYLESQSREYSIQLYSEGKPEDLPEFRKYNNLTYRLNDDHFDTLHHMVCADILVMSKSTFSYLPALLNAGGIIVYKPFWLLPPKPLESEWLIADQDGHLTTQQTQQIQQILK